MSRVVNQYYQAARLSVKVRRAQGGRLSGGAWNDSELEILCRSGRPATVVASIGPMSLRPCRSRSGVPAHMPKIAVRAAIKLPDRSDARQ